MQNKFKCILIAIIGLTAFQTLTNAQVYFSGKVSAITHEHTINRNTGGFVLPVPDSGGTTTVDDSDFGAGVALGYQFDLGSNFTLLLKVFTILIILHPEISMVFWLLTLN